MESHNDDIFTKIKLGLNKGLRVVNIRSKEAYDTLKVKNQIHAHKRKKGSELRDLGEFVYKMFKTKDEFDAESIKNKCTRAAKIEQEISDLEEELRLVHENAGKELGKIKAITKPDD
ncbi:MAG: hypothetical protein ACRENO_02725 [Thermodesulfobacteriota bacterium]